jgi:hypothetical protein
MFLVILLLTRTSVRPEVGVDLPDDVRFLVYARKLNKSELPNDDPAEVEKYEYMLYSNDNPVFEYIGVEDVFNRGRKIFMGAEDPQTGEKKMMQVKQMVIRSVIKARKTLSDEHGRNGTDDDEEQPSQVRRTVLVVTIYIY